MASCEVDYNIGKAGNSTANKSDYFTKENLNKYLVGKGTVSSITYNENGNSTVTYTSIENKNITNQKFKVDQYGKVEIQLSEEENISNLSSEELAILEENENIKAVITGEGGNVPIPVNCTYLTGSNNEESSNYGVVIKDSKNNEWVWIPVPDATVTDNNNVTIKESGTSQKLKTGLTDYTKANNMYDVAGNCWEWTMEADYTHSRANRGGVYVRNGSYDAASYRSFVNPDIPFTYGSSRPTLIVNPVP